MPERCLYQSQQPRPLLSFVLGLAQKQSLVCEAFSLSIEIKKEEERRACFLDLEVFCKDFISMLLLKVAERRGPLQGKCLNKSSLEPFFHQMSILSYNYF